ncbi:MAG: hypothetical protein J1F28_06010 [Oscillospiraceae bacterium]|nr:hypothetical protein [Oscillospiraceae bacterium]
MKDENPFDQQLRLDIKENINNIIPDVPFLKKRGIKPSAIYNSYWKFAAERQKIFELRRLGAPYPWTSNSILLKYKFTNTYRASDRVSQYLIKRVIYPDNSSFDFSPEDVFFRIILFKLFNKIETWEYLEKELGIIDFKSYSFKTYDKLLLKHTEKGEKIYSAAYIMPSGSSFGYRNKHSNNLKLIEYMMSEHIVKKISLAKSLKELYDLLLGFPSLGKFLAFQYAIDINYSELCDFSEMDFVVAGPGAKSGISKLFSNTNGYSNEYIIQLMAENQEQEFQRLNLNFNYIGNRQLQLIDCQNIFCETDKYTRVAYPNFKGNSRTRIKQHFTPNLMQPIEYFYPPKWHIVL